MRPSVRLGTVSGIRIGLHWSVAVVAFLFTLTLSGQILPAAAPGFAGSAYFLVALSTAALLMASIVAHELGHSIVARRNGVGIRGITLFALGGVAMMDREPRTAGAAFRVAIAGPLVSVGLGVVSLGVAAFASVVGLSTLTVAAITWLGLINLGLAVFNMLPALPLDGGRVLQAAMWRRSGDRLGATVKAAGVGRMLGNLVMLLGFFFLLSGGSGLWTILIGWFVASSAKAEELRARAEIFERELKRDAEVRCADDAIDVERDSRQVESLRCQTPK